MPIPSRARYPPDGNWTICPGRARRRHGAADRPAPRRLVAKPGSYTRAGRVSAETFWPRFRGNVLAVTRPGSNHSGVIHAAGSLVAARVAESLPRRLAWRNRCRGGSRGGIAGAAARVAESLPRRLAWRNRCRGGSRGGIAGAAARVAESAMVGLSRGAAAGPCARNAWPSRHRPGGSAPCAPRLWRDRARGRPRWPRLPPDLAGVPPG
jgi:hypothetical protein